VSRKTKERKRHRKQLEKKIPSWIGLLSLGLLVVGTFLIRVIPGWDQVFINGQVWFREVDALYHMRLVDNMMINFPHPLEWDMLALYPDGMSVGYFPMLSWIIASFGHIFNYELVGAFLPPILGALTLIPIYFICKKLWKDWVGLIACGLVMILPSELFHRTMLGFTDHHMLEIFFLVNTLLFLVFLSKERKFKWVILSGISLGLYMSAWGGGLILVSLIWIWFFITFLLKLSRKEETIGFCWDISIIFGIGNLIFLPNIFFIKGLVPYAILLIIIDISPIILGLVSKRLSLRVILGGTICCIILAGLLMQLILPVMLLTAKSIFSSPTSTIQEAMPVTPGVLISHYGTSFLLFLGGLIFLIKRKENLLITVWFVFMLILGISQRRWSYYFTICDAILAGYFIYLVSGWIAKSTKYAVVVVICILLIATTIKSTIGIANLPGILTPGWYNSCIWLKENTPEVEGYYSLDANKADYGVLSWWDYGDFIERIGHRAPCSNPMCQTTDIQWKVFLAQSEEEADSNLTGINYIMVDEDMVTGKLYAIVRLAINQGIYINPNIEPFIFKLWNETTTTWKKVYQYNEVKIFGRT